MIVGGGFVGYALARRLERRLRRGEAEVVVVEVSTSMTYQPFLAEVAAGSIEPRHISVPLRISLRRTRVVTGRVTEVDNVRRRVHITLPDRTSTTLDYDELVPAVGSVSHVPAVPGLAGNRVGFTTLAEARALRDRVLTRLTLAMDTDDPAARRTAATFVVIGGGYTGVEAVAELQSLAVAVARRLPGTPVPVHFELIEAGGEILPELRPLSRRTRGTAWPAAGSPSGCTPTSSARLTAYSSSPTVHASPPTPWCGPREAGQTRCSGGSASPPTAAERSWSTACFRVVGARHLWAAGDAAAVPDLCANPIDTGDTGAAPVCGATAQHAQRQARVLAHNLTSALRDPPLTEYRHRNAGSVASLGPHRGVARIYRLPLRGLPAWLVHRIYHLAMIPTPGRKARIALGWIGALATGRDLTALPPAQPGPWPTRIDDPMEMSA